MSKRDRDQYDSDSSDEVEKEKHIEFKELGGNQDLNIDTKKAAIKASPSVVALVSYSGEVELSHGCGTIIEADKNHVVTVLTSANLIRRPTQDNVRENNLADNLKIVVHTSVGSFYECEICAYNFHFNLLVIKFTSHAPLPVANVRRIDDGLRLVLNKEKLSPVCHDSVMLQPGDPVIAVGRYFVKPFALMVAPGRSSVDRCGHVCKELFLVTCRISRCGDGAPIVNLFGHVIGVAFHDWTTFCLPINIAMMWWDYYKTYGTLHHPNIGFEATNLYLADISKVERLIRRFPDIFGGIVVEKVTLDSSAHLAGLREDDIIVKFNGKIVESFLELLEVMWDNVGETVELTVVREGCLNFITLKMMVVEASVEEINKSVPVNTKQVVY